MVSRIMLSLRKAADADVVGWAFVEAPMNDDDLRNMEFFRPRRDTISREDNIPPGTYTES